ncbi:RNA dependent RNA polymerase-domain-containing protein [Lactifluus subvellereus]|nr:RNA dependent RNA polymerase-domain-containing protein [Lactifluus subvellereus]
MELFFHNLYFGATSADVERAFANVLHSPRYLPQSQQRWNFRVYLFPPKKNQPGWNHRGCGTVTLPEAYLGQSLLGDIEGLASLSVSGRRIQLKPSTRGRPAGPTLEKLRNEPYVPPELRQRRAAIQESFRSTVMIHTLQLGWETRGGVFSVEWEKRFQGDCNLAFSETKREVRIRIMDQQDVVRSIGILWSQISWSATGYGDAGHPAITLSLFSSPTFDIESSNQTRVQVLLRSSLTSPEKRQRLLVLYPDDPDFIRVLPFATLCIRLLCHEAGDLKVFKDLCKTARLPAPKDFSYHAEHLELFSEAKLERYRQWITRLDCPTLGRLADTKEILSIRGIVDDMVACKGADFTANFLRSVVTDADLEIQGQREGDFKASIQRFARNFSWSPPPHPWDPREGVFNCLHVSIAPTSMRLDGPFPERSNRVLRTYAANHDAFIRVTFVEETDLQYRHDREIDGQAFIRSWVIPILRNGLTIAGRRFCFLAYSQSALKSHTVWFVREKFTDPKGDVITAATIIERLGRFDGLVYDEKLIYCPARYAARISQAFTTTESTISVPAEEILIGEDINEELLLHGWRRKHLPGTCPENLEGTAKEGCALNTQSKHIRLVGAKGMLSVDPKLSGDVVVLRPSMIKFDAPHSTDVEVARAFSRPSKYYLNRPLIMILEGLGIQYEVFKDLQDAAVQDVEDAVTSLEKAANTLDQFGLGASYRLSSTLLHLAKLGIDPSDMDDFYHQMLAFSIHHILRELKHHARIPVKDGYTLVGVADTYHYLQEDEVFACVTIPESNSIHFLEGPVLISRSPIIHPGDVQVVRAIGQPPVGSPFAVEPLMNTVVFSVNGDRPLPSYLGGGDLDGDVYNVTWLTDLHPPQNITPAAYDPATRKLLDRPSTMDDVADFVADYISNDILGMVAINWLLIADLNGIFDPDCLKLCQAHSDAVDYPKSGTAVELAKVPKPRSDSKPDWHAPETVDLEASPNYYESKKAIGRLFRDIDLPEVQTSNRAARRRRQHVRDDESETDFDELFAALCIGDRQGDRLESAVERRITEFTDVDPHSHFVKLAVASLGRYSMELQGICASNTLQRHKGAMLSEEEAVVGTIAAKCSQRGRRRETMAQLREQTGYLVKAVRDELSGDEETSLDDWLATAWAAWKVSRQLKDRFGAHSYGWIALGEVFDAMKAIEQDGISSSRR